MNLRKKGLRLMLNEIPFILTILTGTAFMQLPAPVEFLSVSSVLHILSFITVLMTFTMCVMLIFIDVTSVFKDFKDALYYCLCKTSLTSFTLVSIYVLTYHIK